MNGFECVVCSVAAIQFEPSGGSVYVRQSRVGYRSGEAMEAAPPQRSEQFPCHEAGGFAHYLYHPERAAPPQLLEWPPVWATAIMEDPDVYTVPSVRIGAFYTSREDARSDARRMAASLADEQATKRQRLIDSAPGDPVERHHYFGGFDWATQHEYVLYGPLSSDCLLTLATASSRDALAARIVGCQVRAAYRILVATERCLGCLPRAVRLRIYASAFSARALLPVMSPRAPPPVAITVRAHVTNGPPDDPGVFRIHTEWIVGMPCHATINDFKRKVHAQLWSVNMTRQPGGRISNSEMAALSLDLGVREDRTVSCYLSGTRRILALVGQLDWRDGMPTIYVFV